MNRTSQMVERLVDSAAMNPDSARALRNVIASSINTHKEGSEAHSHLLETLNNLDNYIAKNGCGYAREPKA